MFVRKNVPSRLMPQLGGLFACLLLGLLTSALATSQEASSPDESRSGRLESVPAQSAESLPQDAQLLVNQFQQQQTAIRNEAEQKIQVQRQLLIQQLQQLQDRFTREAKLDEAVAIRDRIRQLSAGVRPNLNTSVVSPDPGTLSKLGGRVGESFQFLVTGKIAGTVWGTDTYTTDSPMAVAAVHAGVLAPGQPGIVRVTILPGQSSYQGSTRHGVTSHPWGSWGASYRFEPAYDVTTSPGMTGPRPEPESFRAYRDKIGQTFEFEIIGTTQGTIWGTDVYTDDSPLGTAAVHSGILTPGERGVVRATILSGRESYTGSTRFGITSRSYGQWGGSYRIARVEQALRNTIRTK